MKSYPVVSVIIPVYNCERYAEEAIRSVLAQDYEPLEVVVVDDGSTDQSADVAKSFGALVRYCYQERAGIGAARNRGVELASGELLAFLDADDRWVPAKLNRQVPILLSRPAIDIVFGRARQLGHGKEWDRGVQQVDYDGPDLMAGIISGTMLIRRESFFRVGPFRTDLKIGEFVDWYARAVDAGLSHLMLPDLLLYRRLHDTNQGVREREAITDYARVLKAALDRRRAIN
jgi:glycosyltransferase involved in cell wall biosynthesis